MRRLLPALLFLLLPGLRPAAADETRPVSLPGAFEFSLSRDAGEDYRVMVYRPEGEPPGTGWPALYVLDADRTFLALADFIRSQGRNAAATGVLPMVVVGIEAAADSTARRARDFTPKGETEFRDFLETRVKPAVRARVALDPARDALIGHSYGGLFTLRSALARPLGFAAYAALSPSLWWGEATTMTADLQNLAAAAPPILITAAEYDQAPDPAIDRGDHAAIQRERRMVDNARAFAARLDAAGVPARFVLFPGETHGSVIPAALARAARFISHAFRNPTP